MKICAVQSCSINKNNNPQFKGTVSPEFVRYVNELRQDCLKTAAGHNAESINKTCDSILKKSTEVMEKCFHPLSVLTINKTKFTRCDTIEIPGIITRHAEGHTPSLGFLPIRGQRNPQERLDILSNFINSNFTFNETFAQELVFAKGVIYLLSKSNNINYIKEASNETLDLLKWWEEHLNLLTEDEQHNKPGFYKKTITWLIQELENLKNTAEKTAKEQ